MDVPRIKTKYREEVVPKLFEEFSYGSVMQVPRLSKIVVNVGVGEAVGNARALDAVVEELTAITGQKPIITRAKKSIANFKIREGNAIGVAATLRGNRMWEFFDRTVNASLPRVRDFQGVSRTAFDGRGNFSLGIREQIVFPEIDFSLVDRIRSLQVSFVTTARSDEEGRRLLDLLACRSRGSRRKARPHASDRPHRRYVDPHPQRGGGATRPCRDSHLKAQGRDRGRPRRRGLHQELRGAGWRRGPPTGAQH